MFQKVLKKCLKVCGKAIQIPRLNDARVKNREKNCILLEKELFFFGQFYAKYFNKKQFHCAQNVLHCERQQVQTSKLCNTRCSRDNANVIT